MLELGLAEGEPFAEEERDYVVTVLDFWERASRAYRNDGLLLPVQSGGTLPILADEHLGLMRGLMRPAEADAYAAARRMAATLELDNFVLHGEQRDGVFGHGPYPGEGGRTIVVREFNDLRNDYLPGRPLRSAFPSRRDRGAGVPRRDRPLRHVRRAADDAARVSPTAWTGSRCSRRRAAGCGR